MAFPKRVKRDTHMSATLIGINAMMAAIAFAAIFIGLDDQLSIRTTHRVVILIIAQLVAAAPMVVHVAEYKFASVGKFVDGLQEVLNFMEGAPLLYIMLTYFVVAMNALSLLSPFVVIPGVARLLRQRRAPVKAA